MRCIIAEPFRRATTVALATLALMIVVANSPAADIGFVVDPDRMLDQSFDQFWVNRLTSQGHNVSVLPANWDPADPDVMAADIFIVSNDVGSGDFISNPNIDRLFNLNPVDLTGHSNVEVTVAMAARATGWDVGIDFVRFLADADGDGVYETELADIQPTLLGDLEHVGGGTFLFEFFQDVTFPVPDTIDTLRLQVDARQYGNGRNLRVRRHSHHSGQYYPRHRKF